MTNLKMPDIIDIIMLLPKDANVVIQCEETYANDIFL